LGATSSNLMHTSNSLLVQGLAAHGQTTNDLLINLFTGSSQVSKTDQASKRRSNKGQEREAWLAQG
jgi:hypothetical protein